MFNQALSTRHADREPLFNLIDRFFNDSAPNGLSNRQTDVVPTNRTWMPPVDIFETDDAFIVTADLPGLTKDDLEIDLENNLLTVSGERRFEKGTEDSGTKFRRVERAYGSFRRSFNLPSSVDAGKVEATFKDGVLTLNLPKAELAKARKIAVA